MPYIRESRVKEYATRLGGYSWETATRARHALKAETQTGFRTGSRAETWTPYVDPALQDTTWGKSRKTIEALSRIIEPYGSSGARTAPCNDRDYRTSENCLTEITTIQGTRPPLRAGEPRRPAHWTGNFLLGLPSSYHTLPTLSDAEVKAWAVPAMRDSRPTAPHAEMAQFLAELGDAKKLFQFDWRKPGSAYLNYQFGWSPTVSDLKSAAQAVLNSKQLIRQFIRDSGQLVHRTRRKTVSEDLRTITVTADTVGSYGPSVRARGTLQTVIEVRAFADFEYFVHDPDSFLSRFAYYEQQAQHLLGLRLSASTLWELTPFSWLLDWFVDFGGLLAYQDSVANDGLVAHRAGWVVETRRTLTCGGVPEWPDGARFTPGRQQTILFTLTHKRQRRRPVSPYAFTADLEALNPRRSAILVALGLAKANH